MKIRATPGVLAFLAFASLSLGAEIGIGDSRDDVLRQVGKPSSIAKRGEREIFLYPKGGRVEFIGGKVADVKNPLPAVAPAPTNSSTKSTVDTPPAPAPQSVTPPPQAPAFPPSAPADTYNPADAANELAKHVEKMNTPWGEAAAAPDAEHSPLEAPGAFVAGLILRFTFTLIALKIAFRYWEMDAFWSGIFAIAGIDLALHAIFQLLGPVTSGFTTMAPVENGIPGLVLIFTIHRFCFNKRLQNAVFTAAVVKLVVTLCYLFAGIALLDAVF